MRKLKLSSRARKKSLALAITAISAATIYSPGSFAQDNATNLEEITVTGTRIRATDGMAAPTPVTAITTGELTDFEPGGTVAEQLDALPQFFGTQSAQRGGGALFGSAGGSFLNMRSLGANRTLVLLDGSRVVPADKRGSVNVDTFPTALVRTVDVVTGGASAAYGADALGGVTNFVLDREFEGFKVQAGTGINEWGDGEKYNVSVAGGTRIGDRLNIIGSIDAKHIAQIDRDPEDLNSDWFQRWGYVTCDQYQIDKTGPRQCTYPWVSSSQHSPYGLIRGGDVGPDSDLYYMKFTPDGTDITPFVLGDHYTLGGSGSTRSMAGGPEGQIHNRAFGGGPQGQEVVGRSFFLGAQYEFSDNFTAFAQAMGGRSESNQDPYGRSGYSMQDLWYATVYRDNAYLPDSVAQIMDNEGLDSIQVHKLGSFLDTPEIGSTQRDHNVMTTQSWQVGFSGLLPNGWDYKASWQSGKSRRLTQVHNKIRVDRMFLGADAVRDPDSGAIVCRVQLFNPTPEDLANSPAVQGRVSSRASVTAQEGVDTAGTPLASPIGLDNTVRDCVPYNVMGNGNISQEAINYIGTLKKGDSHIDQDFAEALLQGEVYEGWGYGPVSFAAGLTYRKQNFSDGAEPASVDALGPPLNDPALGIQGIPPGYTGGSPNLHQFSTVPLISGSYNVWEYFGELQIPIWESNSGQQSLGGSAAFRQSDYSSTGKVEAWKLGLEFAVNEELRLRGTRSRDVREATFSERFDAQGGGGAVDDPQKGNAQVQITSVSGGNPNLRPEIADTDVLGLVYEPNWLSGLQLSVDWYKVKIKDAVGQLGLQRIVDLCAEGDQEQCANITRDPVTGNIGRVFNYYQNVAQSKVEGLDFEVVYRTEPDFFDSQFESFSIRALAGYIISRTNTSATGSVDDFTGSLGNPEWTANITANYGIGPWSLQLQGRYYDGVLRDRRWTEGVDVDDNTVPSSTWWNGRVAYNGETSGGHTWNVGLNVQNIFNRNPPIIPSFSSRGGSQTTSADYDTFGRRYALNMNYNF
jgi:outer membrane receptor protein involved in Fe transport